MKELILRAFLRCLARAFYTTEQEIEGKKKLNYIFFYYSNLEI